MQLTIWEMNVSWIYMFGCTFIGQKRCEIIHPGSSTARVCCSLTLNIWLKVKGIQGGQCLPWCRWRPRTPGWRRPQRRWPSPSQTPSRDSHPKRGQSTLLLLKKTHHGTGGEDDGGASSYTQLLELGLGVVQLVALKMACFWVNLQQSSLTRWCRIWFLGLTPVALQMIAWSSATSILNKQKRSTSCQRYFYGKIRKINEMLTLSRVLSSSWMVSPCWRRTCIFLGKVLSCRWLWVKWAFSLDFSVLRVWISLIKISVFLYLMSTAFSVFVEYGFRLIGLWIQWELIQEVLEMNMARIKEQEQSIDE